jgi:hypothetical protein
MFIPGGTVYPRAVYRSGVRGENVGGMFYSLWPD